MFLLVQIALSVDLHYGPTAKLRALNYRFASVSAHWNSIPKRAAIAGHMIRRGIRICFAWHWPRVSLFHLRSTFGGHRQNFAYTAATCGVAVDFGCGSLCELPSSYRTSHINRSGGHRFSNAPKFNGQPNNRKTTSATHACFEYTYRHIVICPIRLRGLVGISTFRVSQKVYFSFDATF